MADAFCIVNMLLVRSYSYNALNMRRLLSYLQTRKRNRFLRNETWKLFRSVCVHTSTNSSHAMDKHFVLLISSEMSMDFISDSIEVVTYRCVGKVKYIEFVEFNMFWINNRRRFQCNILPIAQTHKQRRDKKKNKLRLTTM